MPALARTTYLEVVNAVARSVGHPTTTDVASSSDEAILRLGYYANLAGQELLQLNNWNFQMQQADIDIIADFPGQIEKGFALPADFHHMTDDTQWDRSTQLPAIGPVNPQDWQWLIVRKALITTRFMWRIRDNLLWVKAPSDEARPFSFEYISNAWARNGVTDALQVVMESSSDYHVYPWQLPILLTRAKWLDNEGYDASKAYADFHKALQYEIGVLGATALSLVPGVGYPYINAARNTPDSGYGSP